MSNYNKKYSDTNIRLGLVRFSFPFLFERRIDKKGNPDKYGLCCLIPKTDKETVALFTEAYEAAKLKGKAEKWSGKIPAKVKLPLHDGDVERPDDEAFHGCWYFNSSSTNKPGVRVREAGIISEAIDASEVYAGSYGAVTVNLYPYNHDGNVGVAVGLNNVIKLEDGERLAGGRSADEDFEDLE